MLPIQDHIIIKEINTALSQNHLSKYVSSIKIQHLEDHSQINYQLVDKVQKIRSLKEQILNTITEVSSMYDIHILSEI